MIDEGNPRAETDFPMAPNDLVQAIKEHDLSLMRSLYICFPACVYSYDRTTHKAEVMPLVKQAFFNGEWGYLRRGLVNVSVRSIQCGGFTINLPLYVGDTGWLFVSDRDTDLLKQESALTNSVLEKDRPVDVVENDYQQRPNTHQLHIQSSGFFIPDNWGRWEFERFKDNNGIPIGESLYIGSSIDTQDMRSVSDGRKTQTGEAYEKKTTSSIVFQRNGGAYLSSSTDKETNRNSHVSVTGDAIEIKSCDAKNNNSVSMSVNQADGITIRQDITKKNDETKRQHFLFSANDGRFTVRMVDNTNVVSLCFENGKLHLSTTGDVNMNSQGSVNVNSSGNTFVNAKTARIIAEEEASVSARSVSIAGVEDANINSAGSVNIGAVGTTNINAGDTVNVAAGNNVSVSSAEGVSVSSDGVVAVSGNGGIRLNGNVRVSGILQVDQGISTTAGLEVGGNVKIGPTEDEIVKYGDDIEVAVDINGKPVYAGEVPAEGGPAWIY